MKCYNTSTHITQTYDKSEQKITVQYVLLNRQSFSYLRNSSLLQNPMIIVCVHNILALDPTLIYSLHSTLTLFYHLCQGTTKCFFYSVNKLKFCTQLSRRPCHGSGSWLLASHHGGSGSITSQFM
jgi:hypothetical protein